MSKRKADIYSLGDIIGRGAFGKVFRGFNTETGDLFAIKRIRKEMLNAKLLPRVIAEGDLLLKLDHRNIVRLYDRYETDDCFFFVLEYMESGSLFSIVKKHGPFSEGVLRAYMIQVLAGLQHLHEQGIIHRDIKGSNILMTKDGTVKLADFGSFSTAAIGTVAGTPHWMAPEVITEGIVTHAADIWSLGCTLIELLTGKPPYSALGSMPALYQMVEQCHPPIPDNVTPELQDFIRICFVREHELRPSATALLEHVWIAGVKSKYAEKERNDKREDEKMERKSSYEDKKQDEYNGKTENVRYTKKDSKESVKFDLRNEEERKAASDERKAASDQRERKEEEKSHKKSGSWPEQKRTKAKDGKYKKSGSCDKLDQAETERFVRDMKERRSRRSESCATPVGEEARNETKEIKSKGHRRSDSLAIGEMDMIKEMKDKRNNSRKSSSYIVSDRRNVKSETLSSPRLEEELKEMHDRKHRKSESYVNYEEGEEKIESKETKDRQNRRKSDHWLEDFCTQQERENRDRKSRYSISYENPLSGLGLQEEHEEEEKEKKALLCLMLRCASGGSIGSSNQEEENEGSHSHRRRRKSEGQVDLEESRRHNIRTSKDKSGEYDQESLHRQSNHRTSKHEDRERRTDSAEKRRSDRDIIRSPSSERKHRKDKDKDKDRDRERSRRKSSGSSNSEEEKHKQHHHHHHHRHRHLDIKETLQKVKTELTPGSLREIERILKKDVSIEQIRKESSRDKEKSSSMKRDPSNPDVASTTSSCHDRIKSPRNNHRSRSNSFDSPPISPSTMRSSKSSKSSKSSRSERPDRLDRSDHKNLARMIDSSKLISREKPYGLDLRGVQLLDVSEV